MDLKKPSVFVIDVILYHKTCNMCHDHLLLGCSLVLLISLVSLKNHLHMCVFASRWHRTWVDILDEVKTRNTN